MVKHLLLAKESISNMILIKLKVNQFGTEMIIKDLPFMVVGIGLLQVLNGEKESSKITADGDRDWAGDKAARKSTSGSALKVGPHVVKTWS